MLHKKEAALLRPYIEPEMQNGRWRPIEEVSDELTGTVRAGGLSEPRRLCRAHTWVAGPGRILGVTFGMVVAMDSPSARPAGGFNWASTMWHEMSHVYVLTATKHFFPRWFTEGWLCMKKEPLRPIGRRRMTPEIVGRFGRRSCCRCWNSNAGSSARPIRSRSSSRITRPGRCAISSQEMGRLRLAWHDPLIRGQKNNGRSDQDNLHESPKAFDTEFTAWLNGTNSECHRRTSKSGKKA